MVVISPGRRATPGGLFARASAPACAGVEVAGAAAGAGGVGTAVGGAGAVCDDCGAGTCAKPDELAIANAEIAAASVNLQRSDVMWLASASSAAAWLREA